MLLRNCFVHVTIYSGYLQKYGKEMQNIWCFLDDESCSSMYFFVRWFVTARILPFGLGIILEIIILNKCNAVNAILNT